jgi:hypothetical protein
MEGEEGEETGRMRGEGSEETMEEGRGEGTEETMEGGEEGINLLLEIRIKSEWRALVGRAEIVQWREGTESYSSNILYSYSNIYCKCIGEGGC